VNIWQSYKQDRGCLVHFVRLATTLLNDEENAGDNHVLACNFVKYPSIIIFFTDRLSNKPFLIKLTKFWLMTTPPHLKNVPTLPCNLSLIACFLTLLCHKLVWQHMQGVVGFLIFTFTILQIYCRM